VKTAFVVAEEGESRRKVPVGSLLVIGRAGCCGMIVDDLAASREHLEITEENGEYVCRDLGSSNGTKVNGKLTDGCTLSDGDVIRLGDTTLVFEIGEEDTGVSGKTRFIPTVLDAHGREQEQPPPTRTEDLLEAAYTLMNALASNFNPCDLVDRILSTTMEAIKAQRGAVLFAGPSGDLRPCDVCGTVHTIVDGEKRPADVADIEISETAARRVLEDGENVLYQSGWSEGQWQASVSIQALKLTSILCVPIRTQDQIMGILYVDTDLADHTYSNDDLLLAAAAGNSAGLALQNARNHKAIMDKQRTDQEIAAAGTIQEGFLVKDWPDDDPRFEVHGETRPAKIVGGDFYDFVRLDNDTVGIFIGDVSGKGIPAALTMALLLAEFRLHAHRVRSPAEVIIRLNSSFVSRSRRGTFCTICYVIINLRTGELTGANAGHHPLVVVSNRKTEALFDASGPPVGVVPGELWQDSLTTVSQGATLVLYTDGIVEARSATTQISSKKTLAEYEQEGLEALLVELADNSPKELIDGVLGEIERYTAPLSPHDDCTMIALRYNGDD
jgi:sigma-B regulation protein RsbU (phosphoserine phosphatase)